MQKYDILHTYIYNTYLKAMFPNIRTQDKFTDITDRRYDIILSGLSN